MLVIHGKQDELIPYQHGARLYRKAVKASARELFLSPTADHNTFDHDKDILAPLGRFLRYNLPFQQSEPLSPFTAPEGSVWRAVPGAARKLEGSDVPQGSDDGVLGKVIGGLSLLGELTWGLFTPDPTEKVDATTAAAARQRAGRASRGGGHGSSATTTDNEYDDEEEEEDEKSRGKSEDQDQDDDHHSDSYGGTDDTRSTNRSAPPPKESKARRRSSEDEES